MPILRKKEEKPVDMSQKVTAPTSDSAGGPSMESSPEIRDDAEKKGTKRVEIVLGLNSDQQILKVFTFVTNLIDQHGCDVVRSVNIDGT